MQIVKLRTEIGRHGEFPRVSGKPHYFTLRGDIPLDKGVITIIYSKLLWQNETHLRETKLC